MNYNQAMQEYMDLFHDPSISTWEPTLTRGNLPLEAYRTFRTKEAAETFIHGGGTPPNIHYDVYAGATISVVGDNDASNNGLYLVENDDTQAYLYKLTKVGSDNEGTINVYAKEWSTAWLNPEAVTKESPYIYFVGVDTSTATQEDVSTLYFNSGIVYDISGRNLFNSSDERLKDIKSYLDVNVDRLAEISKIKFSWKADKTGKVNLGVTAQSVEEVFPELVVENPDTGYKMVNYNGLAVVALAAIDKLNDRLNELEERIDKLS